MKEIAETMVGRKQTGALPAGIRPIPFPKKYLVDVDYVTKDGVSVEWKTAVWCVSMETAIDQGRRIFWTSLGFEVFQVESFHVYLDKEVTE